MAESYQELRAAKDKIPELNRPISGKTLLAWLQSSYESYWYELSKFGLDAFSDEREREVNWQKDFTAEMLHKDIEFGEGGVIVERTQYKNLDTVPLPEVEPMEMLKSLQEKLAAAFGVEDREDRSDELQKVIWQKELVEGVLNYPVNLQRDGQVSIGF